jgi:predicted metalloprotease with PDZ domain
MSLSNSSLRHGLLAASALLLSGLSPAWAQGSIAGPALPTPPLPKAANIAYPGTLAISVDATDLDRRILRTTMSIPVAKAGDLVLLITKWMPGSHTTGNIQTKIAGLKFSAGGKPLVWQRDPLEVNAFHISVPEGVKEIQAEFAYLAPTEPAAGRIVITRDMLDLQWGFASLYPAGYYVSRIPVQVKLKLPEGWGYATGLETESKADNVVTFKPTDYETLIDSPVYSGRYFKTWEISSTPVPVRLNLMADKPGWLEAAPEAIEASKALVDQAYKAFGSHHFEHYDFLIAASDKLGGIGLEHHRSTEIRRDSKALSDWKGGAVGREVLAHEFAHSWNGKFRRANDLWTPDYQTPMRDTLMWVYEGQTQYWGYVLGARSGLISKEQALQALANTAANLDTLPGREWRPLEDTGHDPIIANRAPQSWRSYQRSEDYYNEGMLIWFDAATLIMEKTGGKLGLDDFAKAFFGIKDGQRAPEVYDFSTVVATLNKIYPYDWASFLNKRLKAIGTGAPLDGFERGGYKLVYTSVPTEFIKASEATTKSAGFTYSLGFTVSASNTLSQVLWEGPAFKAGLAPGAQLIAVNGKAFDVDTLKAAITEARTSPNPIELVVKLDDDVKTIKIDYHGGLRYPRFEVIPGKPKLIDQILTAR